jgi:hypothetical protein
MVVIMVSSACARTPDPPFAPDPAPAPPQAEIGPGLEMTELTPGRYANAVQKTRSARHARQLVRDDMTSSFVVDLGPDGSATVCRGWRYLSTNDGPEVHTLEHLREQLGYRGRWSRRDGWIHLDVRLDDGVCPRIGEYSHLIPNHAPQWHLRCLPLTPRDHPKLTTPILACQSTHADPQPVFGEDDPHAVPGLLPGRWIVLGAENGLRIWVEANSLNGEPSVRVEPSTQPVPTDAWEHAF